MKTFKQIVYETLKLIVFAILISVFIPNTLALDRYILLNNMTFEGMNISRFNRSTTGDWSIAAAGCYKGTNCLYRDQGVDFNFSVAYIQNSTYHRDNNKSYLIRGWLKDPLATAQGGWGSLGIWNNTYTPAYQFIGFSCETNAVGKFINTSVPTVIKNFVHGSCSTSWIWSKLIINHTSNKIGVELYTSSAESSLLYKNHSIANLQDFGSYFGFANGRNFYWDDIELWTVNTTPILPQYINITIYNGITNAQISGINVTYTNMSNGVTRTNYTSGKYFLLPISIGSWNITAYNNSFARNFGNVRLVAINSTSGLTTQLRFSLFTTNSFDIVIKDEQTLQNITGVNIHVDLLSDLYSTNYSTTTGHIYADLLTPDDYVIRYYATGYQPRLSTYTLTADTYNFITLYLLQSSQNVSLFVLDDTRQPVENAQIHVYRYSIVDNAYIQVNTINTDYEGKAIIDAQKNSEFYRFYIYYNNDLKLSTQPAYITSSELVFTISLTDPIEEQYFKNEVDYTYSCDYNINTRNFRFYYDTNNEASKGCLYLYKVTPQSNTLYNSTCVSSGSSTILLKAANTSGASYTARGIITVDGLEYTLCTNQYNFINTIFDKKLGSFFIIMMTIVFGMIGVFSLPLAFILTPIPLIIGSGLGLIQISMSASIGMFILGIALAIIIQKRTG